MMRVCAVRWRRGSKGFEKERCWQEGLACRFSHSWLCILHEGEKLAEDQMTAIHCDQKDTELFLFLLCGSTEPQTGWGSRASRWLHSRPLFSDWKGSVGRLVLLSAKQCVALVRLPVCIVFFSNIKFFRITFLVVLHKEVIKLGVN